MTNVLRKLEKTAGALCLTMVLLTSCAATAKPAPMSAGTAEGPDVVMVGRAPKNLAKREELPLEVREMLTARMLRHGDEMTELMVAVLLLDYELSQSLANGFADEPKLARPTASEKGTLNALLPAGYFVHQDALIDSARALAKAAEARDDQRLVEAFGQLAKTCVSCHSAYLHDDLAEWNHVEPGAPMTPREESESCDGPDDEAQLTDGRSNVAL